MKHTDKRAAGFRKWRSAVFSSAMRTVRPLAANSGGYFANVFSVTVLTNEPGFFVRHRRYRFGAEIVLCRVPFIRNVRSFFQKRLTYRASLISAHSLGRRCRKRMPLRADPVKCGVAHIADIFRSGVIALVVPFVQKLRLAGKQGVFFAFAERTGR